MLASTIEEWDANLFRKTSKPASNIAYTSGNLKLSCAGISIEDVRGFSFHHTRKWPMQGETTVALHRAIGDKRATILRYFHIRK